MSKTVLYSIIESPGHGNFSEVYSGLGVSEFKFNSMRAAIKNLKKEPPKIVVAEFFYGYGNNYAGVNISNLDVFLFSMQKLAPAARVIVMVDKSEKQHVSQLENIFPIEAVLIQPVSKTDMSAQIQRVLKT